MKRVLWTFVAVGGLAASTVTDRGGFVMAFFALFFGGIGALLLYISRRHVGEAGSDIELIEMSNADPFVDQHGVRHITPQTLHRVSSQLPRATEGL